MVLSTQHDPDVTQEQIHEDIKKYVFDPILPKEMVDGTIRSSSSIRPVVSLSADRVGDSGLTGRKIIVDTYGGYARHGGGAFSGKDCTKVDRSAAYAARYVAKNLVAAGLADKCEIQLSYAIGVATSYLDQCRIPYGTGKLSDATPDRDHPRELRFASGRHYSICWICAVRSISRRQLMVILEEPISISAGSALTRQRN